MKNQTILFAAGGTGGHVIPAYVLAKEIQTQYPTYRCVFVGAKGKFEEEWIPKNGFEVELLNIGGFKSGSLVNRIRAIVKIPHAFWQSFRILKKYKPARMFGIGGYSSGPIMLLASLMGIPCAIIEPNAHAGFSNRLLAKFVRRVYVVFEVANRFFPTKKIKNFGHLIRPEVFELPSPDFSKPTKTITVLGGSQGSVLVNKVFCDLVETHALFLKDKIRIIHQTGSRDYEAIVQRYKSISIEHEVKDFFEDMAAVYKQSHIIIARSGSSVLEFAAIGIPSILIPLTIAADGHQLKNARYLENTKGASVIQEKHLTTQSLFEALEGFLTSDLAVMSEKLRVLRKPHATKDIMEDFLQLV